MSSTSRSSTQAEHIADDKCAHCSQPASNACGNCHCAKYCSRDCQRNGWAAHKHVCRLFASVPLRPSNDHHLVVAFKDTGTGASLHWVRGLDGLSDIADILKQHPSRQLEYPGLNYVRRNPRTNGPMRMHVFYRNYARIDGSVSNRSTLIATQGRTTLNVLGTVIFEALPATGWTYTDIKPSSYRDVFDNLFYGSRQAMPLILHGQQPLSLGSLPRPSDETEAGWAHRRLLDPNDEDHALMTGPGPLREGAFRAANGGPYDAQWPNVLDQLREVAATEDLASALGLNV